MKKNKYLVAYDITSDKRRNAIVNILKDYYGKRVNYSVFECELSKEDFKGMCSEIENLMELREDNIILYLICRACYKKKITLPAVTRKDSDFIINI